MIDLGTFPLKSKTPRFLFADHLESEQDSYRFFVTHTETPRFIMEASVREDGYLSANIIDMIDPMTKADVEIIGKEAAEFAALEIKNRLE